MTRAFFVLLMSIFMPLAASAATVNLVAGSTAQTVLPDSIADDVFYTGSWDISGYPGYLEFGIFDTSRALGSTFSLNVGATALLGSTWDTVELVTFESGTLNFMNTTGPISLASWPTGGFIWDLDFSTVRDQWYGVYFYNAFGAPATGPGFLSLDGVDFQTIVTPSPVPLPAGVWLMLSGIAFLFRRKIFAPAGRLIRRVGFSSTNIPTVRRTAPA